MVKRLLRCCWNVAKNSRWKCSGPPFWWPVCPCCVMRSSSTAVLHTPACCFATVDLGFGSRFQRTDNSCWGFLRGRKLHSSQSASIVPTYSDFYSRSHAECESTRRGNPFCSCRNIHVGRRRVAISTHVIGSRVTTDLDIRCRMAWLPVWMHPLRCSRWRLMTARADWRCGSYLK